MRLFELLFVGQPVELLDIAVHEGDAPASLTDADMWVASGSPVSVYDDLGWIATAEDIVRSAAASAVPFVGICFGHQLVAQALGGRVEKASAGWGIGALDYATLGRPTRGAHLPPTVTMLASHQDQVVEVPADVSVWSRSEFCPHAGLAVGDRMWTMQGHPEFTPELVRAIFISRRDRIGPATVDAALATLDRPLSNTLVAEAIVRTAVAV